MIEILSARINIGNINCNVKDEKEIEKKRNALKRWIKKKYGVEVDIDINFKKK